MRRARKAAAGHGHLSIERAPHITGASLSFRSLYICNTRFALHCLAPAAVHCLAMALLCLLSESVRAHFAIDSIGLEQCLVQTCLSQNVDSRSLSRSSVCQGAGRLQPFGI